MDVDTYSTYEAKARLSEILRKVKGRRRVIITSHGRPIAQVIPFNADEEETTEERLQRLEQEGSLQPASASAAALEPIAQLEGALARFLSDRD